MECSVCNDGLCEIHERDCVFDSTVMEAIGGPCQCPNSKKDDRA